MQDQFSPDYRLGIQCLLQCTYCKFAGNMPVCNTGNHTPVVKVNDAAVVPHTMVFQEQVCEIRAPFLVDGLCSEILVQLVFKHFMRFSLRIIRIFRADDGIQPQFRIHIFMDGRRTVVVTFPLQVDCHGPVTVYPVMLMVDFFYLCQNIGFVGIIVRLPVFPVVVIGIWIYLQPGQKPACTKYIPLFIYKPVSL